MNKLWWVALSVCIHAPSTLAEPEPQAAVSIDGAWVRAMPPSARMTAAYLVLTNRSDTALVISGASAEGAKSVEIHTSREVDGLVRMEQLTGLTLAPGQTVQLTPGGMHLMLLGMAGVPAEGTHTRLCLDVSDGGSACVDAPVQRAAGSTEINHHGHH